MKPIVEFSRQVCQHPNARMREWGAEAITSLIKAGLSFKHGPPLSQKPGRNLFGWSEISATSEFDLGYWLDNIFNQSSVLLRGCSWCFWTLWRSSPTSFTPISARNSWSVSYRSYRTRETVSDRDGLWCWGSLERSAMTRGETLPGLAEKTILDKQEFPYWSRLGFANLMFSQPACSSYEAGWPRNSSWFRFRSEVWILECRICI